LVSGHEFDWIASLARRVARDSRVSVGIGDDAAVLFGGPRDWLVTVDMLLEDVHFTRDMPMTLVGRKALAVNLSDISAMAGDPVAAVVALALPRDANDRLADDLMAGLGDLADEFHVAIVGGDTNVADKLTVSVTLLGHPTGRGPVGRGGARPGDVLCVTGQLGYSLLGRHLTFPPRVHEAQRLHQLVDLHAMIDLSDGIGSDLFHLADRSGCGFLVDAAAIPIHSPTRKDDRSPLDHAVNDGEDFELLFCVSAEDADRLTAEQPLGTAITAIGRAVAEPGVFWTKEGTREAMPRGGFVHRWA
jgi:thiamine-monophosphate kinase